MKAKKQLLGFTAASLTLGAVFMAGGAPIPFYHTYAETPGLDKGVLSLVTVAYFAGTVIALLFLPVRKQLPASKAVRGAALSRSLKLRRALKSFCLRRRALLPVPGR